MNTRHPAPPIHKLLYSRTVYGRRFRLRSWRLWCRTVWYVTGPAHVLVFFFLEEQRASFFRTKVNYVGKWEVIQEKLYQNARQHSLQDYKNRHTNLFRWIIVCSSHILCPKLHYMLRLLSVCTVMNILHWVWGEKLHRDQNTIIF